MRLPSVLLVALLLAGCAAPSEDASPTPTTAETPAPSPSAPGAPGPARPTPTPTSPSAGSAPPSPPPTSARDDVSATGVRRAGEPGWALDCRGQGHQNWRTQQTLVVLDTTPRTLFVAVEFLGPFRSTDGGATWSAIPRGITGYARQQDPSRPCLQEFGRIAVDPADASHLLLSRVDTPGTLNDPFSENAGVWETRDGGESWTQMLDEWMDASGSRAIAFAPTDPRIVYHGVNGMPSSLRGADPSKVYVTVGVAYRTVDGGATWTELPTGLSPGLRAANMLVDPEDADHALLATFAQDPATGGLAPEQRGLLETRDGGATWTSLPLPQHARAIVQAEASPTRFSHLFVVPQIMEGRPVAYASLDGGATWREASRTPEVVAYDPRDAGGLRMVGASRFEAGSLASADGGVTWDVVGAFPSDFAPQGPAHLTRLVFDPAEAGTLYMAGDEAKVWRSQDGGRTWSTLLDLAKAQAADAAFVP